MSAAGWSDLAALLGERDPYCRGAVILGLNQPLDVLAASFAQATNPVVKGFMVGRSIWASASLSWLRNELDDEGLITEVASNFAVLVQAWRDRTRVANSMPQVQNA
jgi:5-dehydro-2-deoxygluconokinase